MASPHVCGLMAYFLGLYPKEFQPSSEDFLLAGEASPYEAEASTFFSHAAQTVFGKLAEMVGFAPTPKKPGKMPEILSPKVLKNAIVRVATDGVLTVRQTTHTRKNLSLLADIVLFAFHRIFQQTPSTP